MNESDTIPNLNPRYFRDNNEMNLKKEWIADRYGCEQEQMPFPNEQGNEFSGFLKCEESLTNLLHGASFFFFFWGGG